MVEIRYVLRYSSVLIRYDNSTFIRYEFLSFSLIIHQHSRTPFRNSLSNLIACQPSYKLCTCWYRSLFVQSIHRSTSLFHIVSYIVVYTIALHRCSLLLFLLPMLLLKRHGYFLLFTYTIQLDCIRDRSIIITDRR